MDYTVLFTPVVTEAETAFADMVPLGLGVFLLFVGLTIAIVVLRKFGVRK